MSSHQLDAVAEASSTHIGRFTPTTGQELHEFFKALPSLMRQMGADFSSAAENMDGRHVHANVMATLNEFGGVIAGLAEHADEVYATHLRDHELWLQD